MEGPPEMIEFLQTLGWQPREGHTLTGVTLTVHCDVDDDPETQWAEMVHFGNPEMSHEHLHAVAETAQQRLDEEHFDPSMN